MRHHSIRVSRVCFVLFAGVLSALLPREAVAQTQRDRDICFSTNTKDYEDPNYWDVGLAACEKFIRSDQYRGRDLAYYVRQKANWLHRKKDYDGALYEFDYAIRLDPNNVESYDYRADVYLELKQYEKAIEEYNRAIRVDPNYPAAYFSRGSAYEKLGKIEDAKESYRQALRIPAKNRIGEWAHTEARKRLDVLR